MSITGNVTFQNFRGRPRHGSLFSLRIYDTELSETQNPGQYSRPVTLLFAILSTFCSTLLCSTAAKGLLETQHKEHYSCPQIVFCEILESSFELEPNHGGRRMPSERNATKRCGTVVRSVSPLRLQVAQSFQVALPMYMQTLQNIFSMAWRSQLARLANILRCITHVTNVAQTTVHPRLVVRVTSSTNHASKKWRQDYGISKPCLQNALEFALLRVFHLELKASAIFSLELQSGNLRLSLCRSVANKPFR